MCKVKMRVNYTILLLLTINCLPPENENKYYFIQQEHL